MGSDFEGSDEEIDEDTAFTAEDKAQYGDWFPEERENSEGMLSGDDGEAAGLSDEVRLLLGKEAQKRCAQ